MENGPFTVNMYFLLKIGIFHCYFGLPEGRFIHFIPTFGWFSLIMYIYIYVPYMYPMGWIPSLKLTWHLKITPWKRRFLLKTIIFRGELLVSWRVIIPFLPWIFFGGAHGCISKPHPVEVWLFGLQARSWHKLRQAMRWKPKRRRSP